MRYLSISLWAVCMLSAYVLMGQETTYLWIKGEQVALTEDRTNLSIVLDAPQMPTTVSQSLAASKHQGVSLHPTYNSSASSSWVLLDLPFEAGKTVSTASAWATQLGLTGVRSVSFGYLTDEGASIWLDHQVSYRPGPGFELSLFEEVLATFPGAYASQTRSGIPYVEVAAIEDVIPLANALYESGLVVFAQPAYRSPTTLNSELRGAAVNNANKIANPTCPTTDPHFSDQYYLENTQTTFGTINYPYFSSSVAGTDANVLPAWCISKGNNGITVAIVDEGVEDHEDLENEDGDSRLIGGYYTNPSLTGTGAPTYDSAGHGQAVAGIVGASHNNLGPSGIAPEVNFLSVHIDKQGSTDLQRADGIMWAYKNGADIILNAWTYTFCTGFSAQVLEDAIDSAQVYGRGGLGSVVVFASGFIFDAGDPTCVQYPATLSNVISVGAIRPDAINTPPDYAPHGPELDLVAVSAHSRAESFVSVIDRMGTLGYNDNTTNGPNFYADKNYFRYFGGTSAASAQVAGAIALVLDVNSSLSYSQIETLLTSNTVDVGAAGFDNNFGNGMLDVYATVVGAQSTFPVEWGYFRGKQVEESIELAWETLSEVNNHKFEVQRKMGDSFVYIGEVQGQGNSTASLTYNFTDHTPQPGENVYRLKQIDFDGAEELGRTLVVNFMAEGVSVVGPYPNPAQQQVSFDIIGQRGRDLSLRLLSLNGQALKRLNWEVQLDVETVELSLENLPTGIYLVEILHSAGVLMQKRLMVRP